MISKIFKIMTTCFALLAMPSLVSAACGERGLDPRVERNHDLRLGDFSGEFVVFGQSVGGVAGALTSGYSSTAIAQASIDKCGNARFHFLAINDYTGPIGTPIESELYTEVSGTITIVDAQHGIGNITLSGPLAGASIDFVAIRSKSSGKVVALHGS